MLRRLEGFEIHLLAFLCRNQVFDREISGQAAQLAQRLSGFDRILFRVLTECYRKTPTKNLLSVICKMLMDGRKKENKYAVWFARGVMQDVRITGLYEAFIETSDHLDANELPMAIRLYFVYHNTLDSARKAAIYAAESCGYRWKSTGADYDAGLCTSGGRSGRTQICGRSVLYADKIDGTATDGSTVPQTPGTAALDTVA